MRFFYTIFIHLYNAGIAVAALFNLKAKQLHRGRKQTWEILESACKDKKIVWFHAASLGEYEQGRPLIERLRQRHPELTFLVTFFSPSGYEVKKNAKEIDIACYLPADTPRNVRRFLDIVRPQAAYFVKYEYWYNFIDGITRHRIPLYYVSAIFRPSQYFFKPVGRWFARQLQCCTHFFVQDSRSAELLQSIGIKQVTITGDTRYDRVYAIAQQNARLDFVESFKGDAQLLVVGSSWPHDEQAVAQVFPTLQRSYKLLLAPHLIDEGHITDILARFSDYKTIRYTQREGHDLSEYQILIVDAIGLLSKIYRYADVAMVGGGFATGLHNTLEAAVFGIPVIFGPQYQKFAEAVGLVNRGGAFPVRNADELRELMQRFENDPDFYRLTCQTCATFVEENLGACDKILENQ